MRFLDLSTKVVCISLCISQGTTFKRADMQHELRNGWGAPMNQSEDGSRQLGCLIEDEEPRGVA